MPIKKRTTKKRTTKRKSPVKKTTVLYKGKRIPRGEQEELRERRGTGSAGKYKGLAAKEFVGPAGGAAPGTFPINTMARARNALARAHFAPNPEGIRRAVWRRYPQLKKRYMERKGRK